MPCQATPVNFCGPSAVDPKPSHRKCLRILFENGIIILGCLVFWGCCPDTGKNVPKYQLYLTVRRTEI